MQFDDQHKPYVFQGSRTGCLVVHGIVGAPAETRALGEYLSQQGYTVHGVCLAGHGGTMKDLQASRWTDWLASVTQAYDALAKQCDHIVLVGFSLGGVLGVLLSQQRPLAGMITMGSRLVSTGDWRFTYAHLLRHVLSWRDPLLPAMAELRQAVVLARQTLPQVTVPALVMHGREDTVIEHVNALVLMDELGSAQKELVWWESTGHHMLVEGPQRPKVYARIAQFVADLEAPAV